MKVCAIMANGFEETEAITVIDLLRRADITVDLFNLSGSEIESSHGLSLIKFKPLNSLVKEDYDLMFIPGGKRNYDNLLPDETVHELIKYFLTNKKLAAICAAPSLIGELGLLKGKKYTCYPGFNSEKYEGTYLNQYYVVDGNLYTARSLAASIEFGLLLVEALKGQKAKEELAQEIVY